MSEYSDTFSYDDWYRPYRNKTVSEIMESLDSVKKRKVIEKLAIKYSPKDSKVNRKRVIEKEEKALCML